MKYLLENNVNANLSNYHNSTPLHISSQRGYIPITELLLSNGAKTVRARVKLKQHQNGANKFTNLWRVKVWACYAWSEWGPYGVPGVALCTAKFFKMSFTEKNENQSTIVDTYLHCVFSICLNLLKLILK